MNEPLAQRMRPKTLAEVCGQQHLRGPGAGVPPHHRERPHPQHDLLRPIRHWQDHPWPGSLREQRHDAAQAQRHLLRHGRYQAVLKDIGTLAGAGGILLYLDEIQYLNKKQQQSLLECIEDGTVTLIASTTENPYFTSIMHCFPAALCLNSNR